MKLHAILFLLCRYLFIQAQDTIILSDNRIPGNDTIWVYTPAGYDSLINNPAVYLFHGINGNYSSWSNLVNLQQYADNYGVIVICPDGFKDSFYFDSPVIKNSQYESYFTGLLYPELLCRYAIDSAKIFITGLSMGGAGAMYLFLRNPNLFLSAGSTSGVLDLSCSGSRVSLERLLGSIYTDQKKYNRYSAISYLENIANSGKHILFDCGTEDHLYNCNNLFRKKCDELNIRATYISQPGTHNSAYWKKSIRYHFEFFSSQINQQ